ncbi:hypothetical protein PHISCL_09280 [Aspergillus sclerotialis]|uniref:Uncharacterized protein n=1 Tax=Aspergillus sclerotialis TaxID=2070753 RepID=A0A3A2ZMN1_9EURO|nr:hypothetical protein PHISCL_09280 [Aspergillus sclerotialis]
MNPSEKFSPTTKPSLNHFQTPDKTVLEPLGDTAKNTKATASSKRKSGSPIPSGNITRSLKRNSPLDPKDQPTLTQIDFVSRTQDQDEDDGSDEDLDYIGQRPSRRNEVTPTGDALCYDSRLRQRLRQARDTRYDQSLKSTMPNRKSMSGRRDKSVDGGRRRSRKSETPKASANAFGKSNKAKDKEKDKQRKERNKTLTQMDFVQRWVNLDPDDDTALDYVYYTTPKDRRTSRGFPDGKGNGDDGSGSSGSKRRKLDKEEDSKDVKLEKVPLDRKAFSDPVTPQKPRKLEIPSSQSPESPGFAIISSSQFRGATRSPLKRLSANVPRTAQEESPGVRDRKASQNSRPASQTSSIMSTQVGSTMMPSSQMVSQPALENSVLDDASTPKPTPRDGSDVGNNTPTNSRRDRTVVYETDGENDSDDLEGNLASGPPSPTKEVDNHDPLLEDNHDSQNNDSQDLPPINPCEHDSESAAPHSEPPFSSDASLCYRRINQPTQFPQEPIPLLNTQKMAELFPPYNTQLPATDASETQSFPSTKPHSIHNQGGQIQADDSETQSYPSTKSYQAHQQAEQTQPDASETQSCSSSRSNSLHRHREQPPTQDLDNMSTEIVPESSPVTRQDEDPTLNTDQSQPQPRHRSVVQVESSQPVDKFNRNTNDQGSYPRGIISKSDLLTSSVMESISMPQFLMGSQDSVGEPYSVPDG